MALGGKAWTEETSVFMTFRPRDILLCHSSLPSQSRRRMAPRQMSQRRKKAARDGCPWEGCPRDGCPWDGWNRDGCPRVGWSRDGCPGDGCRRRRRKTEMDVPETEGVFFNIVEGFSGCYSLIRFEYCVWVQRYVSLVDDSRGVCVCVCVCECVWVCFFMWSAFDY